MPTETSKDNLLEEVENLVNLGHARLRQGDRDGGIEAMERAIALDPLKAYERMVAINPNASLAWVELGKLRYEAGDNEGAVQAFEKAMALDPTLAKMVFQPITCPFCSRTGISPRATSCPDCGEPLK